MRRWLIVLVLVLAGCASDKTAELVAADRAADTTAATVASTTSTATTTTASRTATVRQYASIIAKNDTGIRNAYRDARPCLGISARDCTAPASISVLSLILSAGVLQLELDGAATPSNPRLIGFPPQEILSLWSATLTAATRLAERLGTKCEPNACDTFVLGLVADSLLKQLDAWRPYL